MSKNDGNGLFDYIRIINMKESYPEEFTGYEPFMVNRAFSYNEDTILFANEINKPDIDVKLNFDFYYYGLPKKKRFGKWAKKDKIPQAKLNRLNNIVEYYNCSMKKAQEIYDVLDKCELMNDFDALSDKGGKTR